MINTSRQKRVIDIAHKKGWLNKRFSLAKCTSELNEASAEFAEALLNEDIIGLLYHYCDYVFRLRVVQALLILTDFNSEYSEYIRALNLVDGSTNKGFLMLELLAKVAPVGDFDTQMCFEYVLNKYEKEQSITQCKEYIKELIYGTDIDKE